MKKILGNLLLNPSDIDDAYQEAVMSIMKTIGKMKHDKFRGWIVIATRWRGYRFRMQVINKTGWMNAVGDLDGNNLLGSSRRDIGRNGFIALPVSGRDRLNDGEPSAACEVLEIQHDVMSAIEKLPKKQKEATIGVFINEKARKEVAKDCSISRPAIDFRINHAIKSLRDSLSQHAT